MVVAADSVSIARSASMGHSGSPFRMASSISRFRIGVSFARCSNAPVKCRAYPVHQQPTAIRSATGIAAYLKTAAPSRTAQAIAAHESPRTTKLYDRTSDEITLDEVERIVI